MFTRDGDRVGYMRQMPGLGGACVEWLHAREIAALASDTNAVEVIPFEDPAVPLPVHPLCIRDMGLTLGEMFDLDALAADCAADGVWEFLFTAPPLKVTGGGRLAAQPARDQVALPVTFSSRPVATPAM